MHTFKYKLYKIITQNPCETEVLPWFFCCWKPKLKFDCNYLHNPTKHQHYWGEISFGVSSGQPAGTRDRWERVVWFLIQKSINSSSLLAVKPLISWSTPPQEKYLCEFITNACESRLALSEHPRRFTDRPGSVLWTDDFSVWWRQTRHLMFHVPAIRFSEKSEKRNPRQLHNQRLLIFEMLHNRTYE